MKKKLGILGGMGPLATADLMIKIVTQTKADTDQEHIRIFIDSNTSIPDRTAALLHGGEDPLPEMISALHNLEKCGAECVILPCNTAHCFLPRLQEQTEVPILNMAEIAADRCAEKFPGKKIALLSTSGTIASGLYDAALKDASVPYLIPDEKAQQVLMHLIYDVVKACRPLTPEEDAWHTLLEDLRSEGAEAFLLACTELPIVAETLNDPGPFIDATAELARAAVLFCGYPLREE